MNSRPSWEPNLLNSTTIELDDKAYKSLVAELSEILYSQFSLQGKNLVFSTEPVSEQLAERKLGNE
jgi:hypothetical protein